MDSLPQKSNTKVRLQCPAGHVIYPQGVIVGTLYKNYGIRLLMSQRVEQGYDFAKLESTMAKMRHQQSVGKRWVNSDPNLRDCYRLTEQQMVTMGAKCKECEIPAKNEEKSVSQQSETNDTNDTSTQHNIDSSNNVAN